MDKSQSTRFLNAFCRIEDELRRRAGGTSRDSFAFLVDYLSKTLPAIAHYRDDLKEYGELRNAIVHKRLGDQAIAEPHPEVVLQIEFIADALLSPPQLESRFLKTVTACSIDDPVKDVIASMSRGSFNQVPAYQNGCLIGLLSADVITHWLGDCFQHGVDLNDNITVGDVLKFCRHHDFAVMSRNATVFDALHSLESGYRKGRRIKAIVITESGDVDGRPIGIVTTLDLPELYSLVNPAPVATLKRRK